MRIYIELDLHIIVGNAMLSGLVLEEIYGDYFFYLEGGKEKHAFQSLRESVAYFWNIAAQIFFMQFCQHFVGQYNLKKKLFRGICF